MPVSIHALPLAVFPALVIVAALSDIATFTISNKLCATLALAFPLAAVAAGLPLGGFGLHLAVGAGGLALGMAMFALGWIGGGDAKLLAAAGLWIGWPGVAGFLLATTLAGGALAVLLLALRTQLVRAHTPAVAGWVERLATPGAPAPYGVAIAIGALAVFPSGDLMQLAHLAAPAIR